jgi:hypothetical protein
MWRYVGFGAVLGVLAAVAWLLLHRIGFTSVLWDWGIVPGRVRFPIWPSSDLLIMDPKGEDISLLLIVIGLNGVTYAILGALVWFASKLSALAGWAVIAAYVAIALAVYFST